MRVLNEAGMVRRRAVRMCGVCLHLFDMEIAEVGLVGTSFGFLHATLLKQSSPLH